MSESVVKRMLQRGDSPSEIKEVIDVPLETSQLPRLMTELLTAGAARWSVGVHFINPAYTSVAGKTRYMRRYGITVHESAACCIGRKAMGLTESSPAPFHPLLAKKKIKSRRHMWQIISNTSKGILPGYFQKKIKPFDTKKKLSNQFPASYKGKIRFVV